MRGLFNGWESEEKAYTPLNSSQNPLIGTTAMLGELLALILTYLVGSHAQRTFWLLNLQSFAPPPPATARNFSAIKLLQGVR